MASITSEASKNSLSDSASDSNEKAFFFCCSLLFEALLGFTNRWDALNWHTSGSDTPLFCCLKNSKAFRDFKVSVKHCFLIDPSFSFFNPSIYSPPNKSDPAVSFEFS
jgi:hypothetical protein